MTNAYQDNFEAIFGKGKEVDRGSWIWDPDKNKLVPRDEYFSAYVGDEYASFLKPLDPFTSPIDGTVISCRSKLRAHNRKHGVTNVADYGENYFERRGKEKYNDMTGNTKEAKNERIETIKAAMRKHGAL